MSIFLEKFKAVGCDAEGAMSRLIGNEQLLRNCVFKVLNDSDKSFEKLKDALEKKDAAAAFEAAHCLKGTTGNVGITPLFNLMPPIVETLRAGKTDGVLELYNELIDKKDELTRELKNL